MMPDLLLRTPRQWVHYTAERLRAAYEADEAEGLAWWVVEECLGCTRTELLLSRDKRDLPALDSILNRLLQHEPIQYIFGRILWRGLTLRVTPATLIPRPETAELVDWALTCYPADSPIRVLDACTGSGCIAIALKRERPQWQVDAFDISAEALEIAKANAKANANADIRFFRHDLLGDAPLPDYDLIVSNPPYVRLSERAEMRPEVLDYEPHTALFVPDSDALIFYRALARLHARTLCVEINEAFPNEISRLFLEAGYESVEARTDSYGKPRFVCGKQS